MYKHFLSYLLIAFLVHIVLGQNASEMELLEAFKFSTLVSSTMEDYINNALPSEANPEGGKILQNVREGLRNCELYAKASLNIEQYKVCSSSLFHDGMATLGALHAKYRPHSSSASRMTSFWL